ncbi:retrovirus-related pol polyprotein from transposon TNT 1-94 [Tanacetum coccineum]
MAVRNFKKFFRRKDRFVRQPREEKKSFQKRDDKKSKSDRKFFRCGDTNHLIDDCPKPPRNKDQKAFVRVIAKMKPRTKQTMKLVSWLNRQMRCKVLFTEDGSEIIKDDKVIGNGIRKNGLYVMKLRNKSQDKLCLATVVDNSTLWHRRLGHANMHLIQSLSSKELVRNLAKLKYDKHFSDACKIGKQAHASHKAKNMVSINRFLELLHMDLFGPSAIKSYGVEESLNVTFDESPPPTKLSPLVDDDVGEEAAIENNIKVVNNNNIEDESIEVDDVINIKESKNHLLGQVIGNLNQRTLRSQSQNQSNFICFVSTIEPKNVNEALRDESWVVAMQEELNQFMTNNVWDLVPLPKNQSVIGTKWVYRNKLDKNGVVSRNKARLVAQGTINKKHDKFEMSIMGELNFFLGIQIKQIEDGIFFNQSKYIKEMLKKFGLENSKPTKTPMSTKIKLTKDDKADSVDSTKYRDKGKRADPPSSSYSSSSFDENEEPSFLEVYEELYDNEDLTDKQKEKRGMFKCLNRYFDTITKYLKNQK